VLNPIDPIDRSETSLRDGSVRIPAIPKCLESFRATISAATSGGRIMRIGLLSVMLAASSVLLSRSAVAATIEEASASRSVGVSLVPGNAALRLWRHRLPPSAGCERARHDPIGAGCARS
jgi:hypothetical protein